MAAALPVDLILATVQIEQPLGDGTRTVGAGWLVSDPTPDGKPRVVLVTAEHVFDKMPKASATIGYRIEAADGTWRYDPQPLPIRDAGGKPLWTQHPSRDVAVISVTAPPEFAKAAIPLAWLAGDDGLAGAGVSTGDDLMALGFPRGLAANGAGFPILRSGKVASYPLGPTTAYPTFLMDFSVYPGNSGGPVFAPAKSVDATPVVAGLLTQEVELDNQQLGIGIVTQARFVREALGLLDHQPVPKIAAVAEPVGARAASALEAVAP